MVKAYAKNPVGAHHGTGDWLLQRLTAIVMALYTIVLVVALIASKPTTYDAWRDMFAYTFFQVATLVTIAALLYHAWVGIRDIVMDYVKPAGVRLTAHLLVAVYLFACLAWSAAILWGR